MKVVKSHRENPNINTGYEGVSGLKLLNIVQVEFNKSLLTPFSTSLIWQGVCTYGALCKSWTHYCGPDCRQHRFLICTVSPSKGLMDLEPCNHCLYAIDRSQESSWGRGVRVVCHSNFEAPPTLPALALVSEWLLWHPLLRWLNNFIIHADGCSFTWQGTETRRDVQKSQFFWLH